MKQNIDIEDLILSQSNIPEVLDSFKEQNTRKEIIDIEVFRLYLI